MLIINEFISPNFTYISSANNGYIFSKELIINIILCDYNDLNLGGTILSKFSPSNCKLYRF